MTAEALEPAAMAARADADAATLERECAVFARYLLGQAPSGYVVDKYAAAHEALPALRHGSRFERFQLRFARSGRLPAKLADSHARIFAPRSRLRNKLIVLLAILETCAPSYRLIDASPGANKPLLFARILLAGAVSGLSLLLGALVLVPAQLILGTRRAADGEG